MVSCELFFWGGGAVRIGFPKVGGGANIGYFQSSGQLCTPREIPPDGRYISEEEAIRRYDQVFVRNETRTRQVSEQVQTGTRDYVCGQRDLGNGFFEDITAKRKQLPWAGSLLKELFLYIFKLHFVHILYSDERTLVAYHTFLISEILLAAPI